MKERKEIMKKATNLKLGAVYINGITGTPCRLITIVPCEGVWMETFDGQGYGETVKFEDVFYADSDEVQDYLDDLAVWKNSETAPAYKDDGFQLPPPPEVIHVRGFVAEDDEWYVGCDTVTGPDGNDYPIKDRD
jgi:hypothetical protein